MANVKQPQQYLVPVMPAATEDRGRLSKNFWLYEFDCKDGTPVPESCVEGLKAFVEKNLQPLRDFFDSRIFITSAYRTLNHNKRVGGADNSFHLYDKGNAFAVDIAVQGVEPPLVKVAIEGLINLGVLEEGGVGLYKNWIHYDNRGYKARW